MAITFTDEQLSAVAHNHEWSVTDEQIEALRVEAAAHGDYAQADLCTTALEGEDAKDRADARFECARVIAEAAAQIVQGGE